MTIALVGATGQLGTDLQKALPPELALFGRDHFDLTDSDAVETALDAAKPKMVINAAAYNLVDRAEDEPAAAFAVNALGTRNLARYCADRDISLLHVSTDFVFGLDARRAKPYVETDDTGPQSAYATSKLAGEMFVRAICPKHFVVRTCGLYGHNPRHGNFVETMLRLAKERKQLRVVDDQHCTPTSTRHLARAVADLIATDAYGLYHATNTGETTWYRFASEIFRLAGVDIELTPITTAEFGAKARRPAYSVLNCDKLHRAIGRTLPTWKDALAEYLADRK